MSESITKWSKQVIEELAKHAEQDNCPTCKQLIAQLAVVSGVKPRDLIKHPPN